MKLLCDVTCLLLSSTLVLSSAHNTPQNKTQSDLTNATLSRDREEQNLNDFSNFTSSAIYHDNVEISSKNQTYNISTNCTTDHGNAEDLPPNQDGRDYNKPVPTLHVETQMDSNISHGNTKRSPQKETLIDSTNYDVYPKPPSAFVRFFKILQQSFTSNFWLALFNGVK